MELRREIATLCQHYKWLDQAHSLIAKCKRDRTTDMTAKHFEVNTDTFYAGEYITTLPLYIGCVG